MRLVITGDRHWTDDPLNEHALVLYGNSASDRVSRGDAEGADRLAAWVGRRMGYQVTAYPAGWKRLRRPAGPVRNRHMLQEANPDVVLAFHDAVAASKGTKNIIRIAPAPRRARAVAWDSRPALIPYPARPGRGGRAASAREDRCTRRKRWLSESMSLR